MIRMKIRKNNDDNKYIQNINKYNYVDNNDNSNIDHNDNDNKRYLEY